MTQCPRCRGAMIPDPDGAYCLCCGYVSYPEPPDTYVRESRRMGHKGKQERTIARERRTA